MASQDLHGERAPFSYEDTVARRWERRRLTLTILVTLAGIALSLWLGRVLQRREQNYAKAVFRASVLRWDDALERSANDRVRRVSTTAAFLRSSDIKDRKDFHTFVNEITRNTPSIEMLAWAPRIPAARRNAHEDAVRKQGRPKYVISHFDSRGQLLATGKREEYYPILFAEPASTDSESFVGFDLGSDAAVRAAMRQAASADLATGVVCKTFSGHNPEDNLLFFLCPARYDSVATKLTKRPADQPEADGFVLGVLDMATLAKTWLSNRALDIPPGIDVYISMNGINLTALCTGPPPKPILDAAGSLASPPTVPSAGGAWGRRSSRSATRTLRSCTPLRRAVMPSGELGNLSSPCSPACLSPAWWWDISGN